MTNGAGADRGARRDRAVRAAAVAGLLTDETPVAGFVDLAGIAEAQDELRRAFAAATSAPVLHTFAAKAASLVPVLRLFAQAGLGCEAASPGELAQALAAGFPPSRIVLDSPAKTTAELRHALRLGIAVNADNLDELDRIAALLAEDVGHASRPALGLRVNPQVGAGSIDAMSTASAQSKFGVPLRDPGAREAIIRAFDRHPWLDRLHVHVGSQGCPLELIAAGVRAVFELAEEINAAAAPGTRRVTSLDIGGGLPVDFADDRVSPTFAEYVSVLRSAVPGLFDGRYGLVTEFGRSLSAKNGFTLARVEYAKQVGGRYVALTHAGAQVATRTVFMPESWPLRLSAYGPDGRPKQAPEIAQDVAGPCCFAGDLLARDRTMARLDPGDLVLLHDTGGYYFSATWSYNSLPRPAVYGFASSADAGADFDPDAGPDADTDVGFTLLRRQQTLDELVAEAGGEPAALPATRRARSESESVSEPVPEPEPVSASAQPSLV